MGKWGNELSYQSDEPEGEPQAIRDRIYQLSVRELEVLSLLAGGKTNKEIARVLCITLSTVKSHVAHILKVLQLESRTSAAVFWTKALHENREAGD
jgi:DNA-binding NarL/FixJ family response regulator